MAKIAFVTGGGPYVGQMPDKIQADDALAAVQLRESGVTVIGALWSDTTIDWSEFELVILRSCWDYHHNIASFRQWLARVTEAGVRILNEPAQVLWNYHKGYLLQLQKQGFAITPTVLLRAGETRPLATIAQEQGWNKIVLKPAISLAGENIACAVVADLAALELQRERLGNSQDLLVQRFSEGIIQEGEWATVFVDGKFSHAFLKRPAEGDFRVNVSLGGKYSALDVPAELLHFAEAILATIKPTPLYARVDMVRQDGTVLLCELELIEPGLYFRLHPPSAATFAQAVVARL